ncbi:MAG: sulfotransferase [Pseudomonadota bacterium]
MKDVTVQDTTPYTILSGQGRSGSNRLLDVLDASRHTACRNEVKLIAASQFHSIGAALFAQDLDEARRARLHAVIADAPYRRSQRDRLSQTDKAYLTGLGRAAQAAFEKKRLRKMLAGVGLLEGHGEWRIPRLMAAPDAIARAHLVLKFNSCPAWTEALALADKHCRVVHNIREPRGFLKSWYNRFILSGIGAASFEKHFDDVPRILAHFGRDDAERLRAASEENLVEVELWRWRYINERLMALEAHPGQYMRVTYDEIQADTVEVARKIFAFSELPFEQAEQDRAGALKNVLFQKPHTAQIDAALCDRLVDKVLEDSPLKAMI